MTPSVYTRPPWTLRLLTAAAVLILMTSLPVSAVDQETCYSRQHQGVTVNVRMAMSRPGTASDVRVVRSERDCVLACCSEEVKPGARCNMAVFNAKKHANEDNCYLFHCPTEQDCPLMKAQEGINTYDIYKGLIHPATIRPVTTTTATTTTTTTTTEQTTTTTTPAPTTTTTTEPPTTTTTTTTQSTTTMPPTTTIITTTTPPTTTTAAPPPIIIIATMPAVTMAPTTTTTTTTTAPTTSIISIKKTNKTSKKQNKAAKKAKPHPVNITTSARAAPSSTSSLPVLMAENEKAELRTGVKPQPDIEVPPTTTTTTTTTTPTTTTTTTTTTQSPTTTPTTTTTTSTTPATTTTTATSTTTTPTTTTTTTTTPSPTTTTPYTPPTTTTTTTPPTTTTTTEPPTTRTSPAASLLIVPKGAVQSDHSLQDQSRAKVAAAGRGAVKSGMVAFMVLGLAVLTLALAVGGRKAMESFDRRHYTRLELNDLHYEV